MIIIEGADLVGKTTFCHALMVRLNELGWPHVYRHMGKPPDCWKYDPVACYNRLSSPYIVQDRFYLSELVYAPLRDASPHITLSHCAAIRRHLRSLCAFMVVVTADPVLIRQRYNRPEMFGLDKVLDANERFCRAAREGTLDGYSVNADLHIHCTEQKPFPSLEELYLRTYTNRLVAQMPYPGGGRA